MLKGPRPEHLKVLEAVGALDRLAHENHLFSDLDAAIAHAHAHVARGPRPPDRRGAPARQIAEFAPSRQRGARRPQAALKPGPSRRLLRYAIGGRGRGGVSFRGHQHVAADALSARPRRSGRGRAAPARRRRHAHRRRAVRPRDLELVRPVPPAAARCAASFGGAATLRSAAASAGLADPSMPELTSMLQSLGSPEALLAMIAESGGASLAPVDRARRPRRRTDRMGRPRTVRRRLRTVPRVLRVGRRASTRTSRSCSGCGPRSSTSACACDGAPACEYRIRWFPDEPRPRTEFLETRVEVLTARLESLHETVGDLVSDDDLERVLAKIVASAAHAMHAPIFVLALEALPSAPKHVYAKGVDDDEAAAPRRRAPRRRTPTTDEHRLVVDVLSTQRRYGRLAAINPTARFFPQERVVLEAYARLAAAALDSASRARRRPPPGPHRTRPARPLELARATRDDRRHGRATSSARCRPSSAATVPRSRCSSRRDVPGGSSPPAATPCERGRAAALDGRPGSPARARATPR